MLTDRELKALFLIGSIIADQKAGPPQIGYSADWVTVHTLKRIGSVSWQTIKGLMNKHKIELRSISDVRSVASQLDRYEVRPL